ncbi:uncharacterized protein K452DRAFT_312036 [Aplosporella prunicola CBS 121167]|uniref:Uncharacterized protein n=1 Tax=Aplosporella prunicola CBS 121167 TaxID=1176127 RepID=A0A6A6B264_9PEZI|nr:uncharacterized protein K452DRAFT_312036 [Aplosporella prunicola CBS 121167]KAF2137906.1 hypothetical protein K452DRAFT_312036 [Aplosporella prunicola CBS 121167]
MFVGSLVVFDADPENTTSILIRLPPPAILFHPDTNLEIEHYDVMDVDAASRPGAQQVPTPPNTPQVTPPDSPETSPPDTPRSAPQDTEDTDLPDMTQVSSEIVQEPGALTSDQGSPVSPPMTDQSLPTEGEHAEHSETEQASQRTTEFVSDPVVDDGSKPTDEVCISHSCLEADSIRLTNRYRSGARRFVT